jgi:hypothetical protein
MHYYQDRLTRSIYSARELAEIARLAKIHPRELLSRFEELPEHQRRLLEETEAAAAKRRREQPPAPPPRRPAGRPRLHFPGL